jgi:hypothetical protein
MKIEDLENNGLLAYRFIRGSHLHGINTEKSDVDEGGVYIAPQDYLYGLRNRYNDIEQISDAKNDKTYYEFGRWIELLIKSNPTALESLFVDKKFIIGDVNPFVQKVIDNRNLFVTKECFKPLLGYSAMQIKKSQGYNKKCMYPENMARKGLLDFCYTFEKQGSKPMLDWLEERGLKQEYCGLVSVPNMFEMYAVFYDWGNHMLNNYISYEFSEYYRSIFGYAPEIINKPKPIGYSGIISRGDNESTEVRLSSVTEGAKPICHMEFSKNSYQSHCRIYREWVDWKKKRNEIRYSDNKGYNYDAKNMCECVRLIHTGIELAKGEGFNVTRTWDRDFLLDIKYHKYTYEYLINYTKEKEAVFKELAAKSDLPETIDVDKVNDFLINVRKEMYSK